MQGRSHAYCPACGEGDLSHGVGEVVVLQGAYHQAVEVVDGHQIFHYQEGEVVIVWREHCLVAVVACGHPTVLVKDGVAYQAA